MTENHWVGEMGWALTATSALHCMNTALIWDFYQGPCRTSRRRIRFFVMVPSRDFLLQLPHAFCSGLLSTFCLLTGQKKHRRDFFSEKDKQTFSSLISTGIMFTDVSHSFCSFFLNVLEAAALRRLQAPARHSQAGFVRDTWVTRRNPCSSPHALWELTESSDTPAGTGRLQAAGSQTENHRLLLPISLHPGMRSVCSRSAKKSTT